ncbi:unnamed protein product [Ambrosiozyma monospora]|uniref:Unnamed protein product n=1 Tax=Ambrosiozyma monospora TaxID=43982 RepID=A0A9W6Z0H5_AMBMO|nr:unnamed protein product [Ambrosiozyma monospora]
MSHSPPPYGHLDYGFKEPLKTPFSDSNASKTSTTSTTSNDHVEHEKPPPYTPSVSYSSLCFYYNELENSSNSSTLPTPVIIDINSTQLNIYKLNHNYTRYASFYCSKLLPEYIDANINIKYPSLSDSYNSDGVNHGGSIGSRSNSSSSLSSLKQLTKKKSKFTKMLKKLSITNNTSTTQDEVPNLSIHEQANSTKCQTIHKLLYYHPGIDTFIYPDPKQRVQSLNLLKDGLLKSISMQEIVEFGNAVDFLEKPFALRFVLANCQFLLISYTSRQFLRLFHKLNIARELSLDLDLRVTNPSRCFWC